jgi:hypothetical protein
MFSGVNTVSLSFVRAYERFTEGIMKDQNGQPFERFSKGIAHDREGYKEWVYNAARNILSFKKWKLSTVGNGEILDAAIRAIELQQGKLRNNLVQWNRRYGEGGRSHKELLKARGNISETTRIEQVLYDLYCSSENESRAFRDLVEIVGGHYDVIAYLFFLKDWTTFMPTRSQRFTEAFTLLGLDYKMVKSCSWENYQGYLERLHYVQICLSALGVPEVRLIDAHSFCWLLPRYTKDKTIVNVPVEWISGKPVTIKTPVEKREYNPNGAEIDFAARDAERRELGMIAQGIVLDAEIGRLKAMGRKDLAVKVEDVSHNAALGYDIHSFFEDGREKFIEVKAARHSGSRFSFFLSENECRKSQALDGYVFSLVTGLESDKQSIWEFPGRELPSGSLYPVKYRVEVEKT